MGESVSRTKYAIKNATISVITQIVSILFAFIGRTIFIYVLNSDYLGVNSLYTNIISVLSFAELGIGNAIVFSLYKPIADKDEKKIQVLMKLFETSYRVIGIVIFLLGLCVIPFLGFIIKEEPDVKENLTWIYILFLANTAISYFFSYKKSLITANQKDYIIQLNIRLFQFIQIFAQSIFLICTHEYLVYLYIQIACTFFNNVVLSRKADKLYPFIKKKSDSVLDKEEKREIFRNIRALFVYKVGYIMLMSTDNIIISALINVATVGRVTNYTMLLTNITNVISQAVNSLTASVGNLSVMGSKEQIRSVMHQLLMLCVWMYGFVAIGFVTLANDFVGLWLGNDYVLNTSIVIALVFGIYTDGVQYAAYIFRTTQGLFVQSRWVPLFTSIINIILSICWGNIYGLTGIFAATGVARLVTTTLVDPWLVYKNNFNKKPFEYYGKYMVESIVVIINALIQYKLVQMILIDGVLGFTVKFVVVCLNTNLLFLFCFGWTKDFRNLMARIIPRIVKRNK